MRAIQSMFIRSGVTAIISRLKEKIVNLKILRSLKLRIFILTTAAGIIPCFILSMIILRSYESRAISVRTSSVMSQCTVLANYLIKNGYLEDTSIDTVNAELEQLSNLYDGRVLIMNSSYKIIKDTYGISEGKYMISEEVVRSFLRESISSYDDENNYIEVTTPIIAERNSINADDASSHKNNEEVVGVILTSVSTEEIRETIDILWKRAHIIIASACVLIVAVSFVVARRVVIPFQGISNAIDAIQEGFDHSEISVKGYLETENVTTAFNHLLGRMKALDDSRQEFVSNVSHELKTPITSVKVLADSLLQQGDDVPAEMYKEFMEDIVHEIDRENDIINDLLTLVRMDKAGATLNIEECDVEELINSVIKRLEPLAAKSHIIIEFEIIRGVVADVDKTKLSLAVTNLIENGIKYNKEGGSVHIKLDAEPMMFTLEISDTGIGIPEEDIPKIYERFYRVDKSHSREIGGNGLGLSITRNVIAMHKGAIKVESSLGEGTTFAVKIPLTYIKDDSGNQ